LLQFLRRGDFFDAEIGVKDSDFGSSFSRKKKEKKKKFFDDFGETAPWDAIVSHCSQSPSLWDAIEPRHSPYFIIYFFAFR